MHLTQPPKARATALPEVEQLLKIATDELHAQRHITSRLRAEVQIQDTKIVQIEKKTEEIARHHLATEKPIAETKRRNAGQARSRRESPFSVAAVCGRKGSCPRVTLRGGAGVSLFSSAARRQNVNFFVGSRVVAVAILFVVGLSLGVCVLCGPSAARRLPRRRALGRCVSGRPLASFVAYPGGTRAAGTVLARRLIRLCRGKRPRGARPSRVVVALFLALVMAPVRKTFAGCY